MDHRLSRLDQALARRLQTAEVAGATYRFECLDDLDRVIDQTLALLPPSGDPATGVTEVSPHFGVLWPSAVALAGFVAERDAGRLAGLAVLELGCGLALPSLVARRLGARRVVATDRHPLVPLFLARNAAANRIDGVEYRPLDWRDGAAAERFDLVLGSDLLYEPWQPGHLAALLGRLLAPGGEALIADPGRRHVDAFVHLAEAAGHVCELAAVRRVPHGRMEAEVMVVSVRPAAAGV